MSTRGKQHRGGAGAAAGPSQRQLRAAELVRHALVEIIAREDLTAPKFRPVSGSGSSVLRKTWNEKSLRPYQFTRNTV